jgi:hypothetical protein
MREDRQHTEGDRMGKELETYHGSCHCGAVSFTFRAKEITSGRRCNCSICIRRGAVMSAEYLPPDAFLELKGLDSLAVYRFGDKVVNHYFCKRCGIYPFHDAVGKPGFYRINLGCVSELDPLALEIVMIDGKDF